MQNKLKFASNCAHEMLNLNNNLGLQDEITGRWFRDLNTWWRKCHSREKENFNLYPYLNTYFIRIKRHQRKICERKGFRTFRSLRNFRFFKWNVLTFEEYKLTPSELWIINLRMRPECLRFFSLIFLIICLSKFLLKNMKIKRNCAKINHRN